MHGSADGVGERPGAEGPRSLPGSPSVHGSAGRHTCAHAPHAAHAQQRHARHVHREAGRQAAAAAREVLSQSDTTRDSQPVGEARPLSVEKLNCATHPVQATQMYLRKLFSKLTPLFGIFRKTSNEH